jgi:hypothetical protein
MEFIERSMARFDNGDLRRLAEIAEQDRTEFFRRNPRWRHLYESRLIATALCQGAGLHFVNGTNGVKDLDVWTFYAAHPEAPFPVRRRGKIDYGRSKFGRHPNDHHLIGRRVDLMARALSVPVGTDPVVSIRSYLRERRTESASELALKGVVLLEPAGLRGTVVWPEGGGKAGFVSE